MCFYLRFEINSCIRSLCHGSRLLGLWDSRLSHSLSVKAGSQMNWELLPHWGDDLTYVQNHISKCNSYWKWVVWEIAECHSKRWPFYEDALPATTHDFYGVGTQDFWAKRPLLYPLSHSCFLGGLSYMYNSVYTQNKEGILPVATLSIALYVLCRSMSASNVAPEVAVLSSAL